VRDRLLPALVFAGLLAVVPLPAVHALAPQRVAIPGWVHFVAVGQTALLATAAAIVLTAIGIRRHDSRAVLVGTAFTAMAALLALHGFATPGILIGYNGVVSFSGGATLPVGGAVLALSAIPRLAGPSAVRSLLWLQGLLLAAIAVLGALGMLYPSLVPDVPEPASTAALFVLVVGLGFYGCSGFAPCTRSFSPAAGRICSSSSGSRGWPARSWQRSSWTTPSSAGGSGTGWSSPESPASALP
jgi:hypothetical protein